MDIFENKIYRWVYDCIRKNKALNHCAHKIMQSEFVHKIKPYRMLYERMVSAKASQLLKVPQILEFELTNICNARCIMCPPEVHLGKDMIDHSLFERITKEGFDLGMRRLMLTGGEPLIDKKIFEKIKFAKEIGYSYVHMFTDGSLLTSINREKLIKSGLDSLTISVDSAVKEEYERIRIRLKFDTVYTNLKEFYKLKQKMGLKTPLVRVNMVALPENKDSRKLFIKTFKEHADILEIIDSHNWADSYDEKTGAREYTQKFRDPCHLLFIKAVVGSNGWLKKCSIDMHDRAKLLDLNSHSLKDALENVQLQQLKKQMLRYEFSEPGCASCSHKESWWVDC